MINPRIIAWWLLAVIGTTTVARIITGDIHGAVVGLACALVGFGIGRSLRS